MLPTLPTCAWPGCSRPLARSAFCLTHGLVPWPAVKPRTFLLRHEEMLRRNPDLFRA